MCNAVGIHWLIYATHMKMFRIDRGLRKSLMEFANGCQNRQKSKWPSWNHLSYHIFSNNWENNISPNHMSSITRNAMKQTIHLFDIIIMQSSKWPPWNNWSEHIVVNNSDREKIISPNHMFSLTRNAIKKHVFNIIIMQRWPPLNEHFDIGDIF